MNKDMKFIITEWERCIDRAADLSDKLDSNLNNIVMDGGKTFADYEGYAGMSSPKVRHFFNNLCKQLGFEQDVRYLEVGTWAGSTLLSFIHKNQSVIRHASAIDNFSQFQDTEFDVRCGLEDGVKSIVTAPYNEDILIEGSPITDDYELIFHKVDDNDNFKFQFLDCDCFELDKSRLFGKYNVYFYDGPHHAFGDKDNYGNTQDGYSYYDDCLDDVFVTIIDDWTREHVQKDWGDISKKMNYEICYEKIMVGKGGAETNPDWRNDWWNGVYVAIVKKSLKGEL
tara:strand:- start:67 stop:915 length:849 start_codon:yes stop_codon:yes gene_type:complete